MLWYTIEFSWAIFEEKSRRGSLYYFEYNKMGLNISFTLFLNIYPFINREIQGNCSLWTMCCINWSKPLTEKPVPLKFPWQSAIALYEKKNMHLRIISYSFTQNKVPSLSSLTYTPSSFNQHGKEISFLFCFHRTHNKRSIPNRQLIHNLRFRKVRLAIVILYFLLSWTYLQFRSYYNLHYYFSR